MEETSREIITKEYETLTYHKVSIDAIPTAVIPEINPPGFESAGHRYTITFETNGYNKKRYTARHLRRSSQS